MKQVPETIKTTLVKLFRQTKQPRIHQHVTAIAIAMGGWLALPKTVFGCGGGFLTFPHWFEGVTDGQCNVAISDLGDIWTIVGNITQIALQLAAAAAVIMVIYGGIRYITSQGQPEQLQRSKQIITNAIIGLVIAILAATIVGFVAGTF